jgi:hypothetical protein
LLGGAAEELALHLRELRAQRLELELENRTGVAALCRSEGAHQLRKPALELVDLSLLQERHLAQHVRARLGGEVDHGVTLH